MASYVVLSLLFVPLLLAVAAYMSGRRRFPPSRLLLLFDCAVLSLDALLCVGFWWREITGHISEDAWLDEYGFLGVSIPMWATVISVPVLLIAAVIRRRVFSKARADATRAA